jgi:cytochrome c oxidase subunit 2
MIEHFVVAASSYAKDIDGLFDLVFWIVGFWFVLAEGVFFYLIFRFKAKKGVKGEYITGEKKSEMKWISTPHYLVLACDVLIVIMAVRVWMNVKQELPVADSTVRIISQQWAWSFAHPGPDGKLDTADDIETVDELHLEVDKTYHYRLTSRDVLHSFSVPVFRLKQDAIPGREIVGWFKPIKTGAYDIQCAEMCGIGHGLMPARVFIEDAAQHAAWVAEQSKNHIASLSAKPVAE